MGPFKRKRLHTFFPELLQHALFSVHHEQRVYSLSVVCHSMTIEMAFYCYYRVVLMTGKENLGHHIASSLVKLILSHPITVTDWGISYDIQFSGSILLKTK
jgi:hypothetical protein